jgi:hypothetical protein
MHQEVGVTNMTANLTVFLPNMTAIVSRCVSQSNFERNETRNFADYEVYRHSTLLAKCVPKCDSVQNWNKPRRCHSPQGNM